MTSDLWYVGKVLANEPDREDDAVGKKGFLRKKGLEKISECNMSEVCLDLLFHFIVYLKK